MGEIDPITGLPKELGIWENLAKEGQKIRVFIEKKKFGKKYTIVDGLTNEVDTKDLAKKLKAKFACGGTIKAGRIELQGDHKNSLKAALVQFGFSPETIELGKDAR